MLSVGRRTTSEVKVVRGTPCALLDAALATIRDKGERHLRDHEEVIQLDGLVGLIARCQFKKM